MSDITENKSRRENTFRPNLDTCEFLDSLPLRSFSICHECILIFQICIWISEAKLLPYFHCFVIEASHFLLRQSHLSDCECVLREIILFSIRFDFVSFSLQSYRSQIVTCKQHKVIKTSNLFIELSIKCRLKKTSRKLQNESYPVSKFHMDTHENFRKVNELIGLNFLFFMNCCSDKRLRILFSPFFVHMGNKNDATTALHSLVINIFIILFRQSYDSKGIAFFCRNITTHVWWHIRNNI